MIIKKGTLVYVRWHDAEVISGWTNEDDATLADHDSTICETVGYLVKAPTKRDPMYIVAATRAMDDGKPQYNAITKIPKAWVEEIKELV